MSVKKIAFMSTASNISGATLALLEIIDCLRARGIDSIVFTASRGPLENKLRERNVTVYKLLYFSYLVRDGELDSVRGKIKWFLKRSLAKASEKKTEKILLKERPDILHINTGISPVGIKSANKIGIPVVWHIREVPETYWKRHVFDYSYEKQCLANADKVICISDFIYNKYAYKADGNALVVYDGVYTDGYELLRKKPIMENDIIEMSLCGYDEFKGHKDAIYALKILTDKGFENIRLTIWGNVEKRYKCDLENIIDKYGLSDKIFFAGYTDKMAQKWADTDIALMCSKGEAFGRVTVEAMAAGALVIGSDAGATPEILENGSGLIYTMGNSEDLAGKIIWAIEHRDEARETARKGQDSILNGKFSMDKNINRLIEIYNDIIN